MQLVIDTNEYLFSFGLLKVPASESLTVEILKYPSLYALRIPRKVAEEVRSHLTGEAFGKFIGFLNALGVVIDEDFFVPFELGAKYESKGLKSADAFIAAYTEWVGADILVTENWHFLTLRTDLPFHIFSAEKCLRFLKAGK